MHRDCGSENGQDSDYTTQPNPQCVELSVLVLSALFSLEDSVHTSDFGVNALRSGTADS